MAIELTAAAGRIGAAAVEARRNASPGWLAARRELAWERYLALPMPSSQRDEDWRRTDISALDPESFVADPGETPGASELVAAMRAIRDVAAPGAALLASTRVGVRAIEGAAALAAQGVVICSLDQAAAEHPELVRRALDTVPEGKLTSLWAALWRGGCFVHVPAGVEAALPVMAAHTAGGEAPAVFPATVAVLERSSSLTLVDVYASAAGETPLLSSAVSALVIGEGARLDHCVIQRWGFGAWHLATHRATLARDARLRMFSATLGSRLQKASWEAVLAGEGAEAILTGVCFAAATQHHDHQSLQHHVAARTRSDLLLKVAVRDRARSVYSGLIDVEPEAQQTDGYVLNRNLILAEGARASGIPRLEIKADDVRCGHGTSVGSVDEEQLFYLRSRGVDRPEAERLIVRGFLQDALDRCPLDTLRDEVAALLDEEIDGRNQAGVEATSGDE